MAALTLLFSPAFSLPPKPFLVINQSDFFINNGSNTSSQCPYIEGLFHRKGLDLFYSIRICYALQYLVPKDTFNKHNLNLNHKCLLFYNDSDMVLSLAEICISYCKRAFNLFGIADLLYKLTM